MNRNIIYENKKQFDLEVNRIKDQYENNLKKLESEINILKVNYENTLKVLDYIKQKNDFNYFCETSFVIDKVKQELINYKLYSQQQNAIDLIENNNLVQIKASRQAGISILFDHYIAWLLLKNENISIGLICHRLSIAKDRLKYIKKIIDKKNILIVEENSSRITIDNNSTLSVKILDAHSLHGQEFDYVFIDYISEDHIRDFYELYNNLQYSMNETSKFIFSSPYKFAIKNLSILEIKWFNCDQFNSNLTWYKHYKDSTELIKTNDSKFFDGLLLAGYSPSNNWSEDMINIMGERQFKVEMEFIDF